MSKKAAFTMVELIFVIVILGILAAVAVPKLNASRQDAKIAAAVADMRTLWDDIHSYYLAQGEIAKSAKIAQMSNVPLKNSDAGYYQVDGADCLYFRTDIAENCVVVFQKLNGGDTCDKAVEKAEFLRGKETYVNGFAGGAFCSDAVKASEIKHLKDAKSYSPWRGITLFFGENGVDFD